VGPIGRSKVAWLFGARVAETILASGPKHRINRPDIWMQVIRSDRRKNSCGTGAVHIWVPAFAGTTHSVRAFVDSIFNSGILCRHDSAISPRVSREVFAKTSCLLKFRWRRECRAPNAPAASCVKKQTHELATTVTPEQTRHSPRNGFTAYFALSPVTMLC
jgi:hypothetical protein